MGLTPSFVPAKLRIVRACPARRLGRGFFLSAAVLCAMSFGSAASLAGSGVTDCNSNVLAVAILAAGAGTDCNHNSIPDANDIAAGTSDDCNTNGTPDECEPDCNENDIPDDCDIAAGTSQDQDNDQFPDECPVGPPPCADTDVNCDGSSSSGDLGIVQSPLNWGMLASQAAIPRADVNRDGQVNAGDIGIIQAPLNWNRSTGPCDSFNCP